MMEETEEKNECTYNDKKVDENIESNYILHLFTPSYIQDSKSKKNQCDSW